MRAVEMRAGMFGSTRCVRRICAGFLLALLGCRCAIPASETMGGADAPVVRLEAAAGTTASGLMVVEPARTVLAEDEVHVPFVTIGPMPLVEWTDAGGTKRRF